MNWTEGLSTRARNALERAGYTSIEAIASDMAAGKVRHRVGRNASATVRGLGAKSIEEVRRWLERKGAAHAA